VSKVLYMVATDKCNQPLFIFPDHPWKTKAFNIPTSTFTPAHPSPSASFWQETGEVSKVPYTVVKDECNRASTTLESLAGLAPVSKQQTVIPAQAAHSAP
jgi:hypothetical protein